MHTSGPTVNWADCSQLDQPRATQAPRNARSPLDQTVKAFGNLRLIWLESLEPFAPVRQASSRGSGTCAARTLLSWTLDNPISGVKHLPRLVLWAA